MKKSYLMCVAHFIKIIKQSVTGIISLFLYVLNLAFWTSVLFITAIIRALIPVKSFRNKMYHLMQTLPTYWINGHDAILWLTTNTHWHIEQEGNMSQKEWYFLIANHQSWTDILVLAKVFNHKSSMLKFFLKKRLIWLPFAGQACWLLDFPFMERPKKSFLKKHPSLKRKDITTTQVACEKFKQYPSTIINFLEGTRFTIEKRRKQQSPYEYLLKPKSTGVATALSVLEGYVKYLIDVTIIYPESSPTLWNFLCGRVKTIIVKIRVLPLPPKFLKNFSDDREARAEFQQWINHVWEEKNILIYEKQYSRNYH